MKPHPLLTLILLVPSLLFGQHDQDNKEKKPPRHFISVNPLNILLFQQAGISYEYKPTWLGFGITTGFIYPNYKTYSNYFIAGPTNLGSLGDYSGVFAVPQVNLYFNKPRHPDHGSLGYVAVKFVYKYMHIDTTKITAWTNEGDGYYDYRKMNDKVNVYGGFLDIGYKYFNGHFFLEFSFGPGLMGVNHNMIVYGSSVGSNPYSVHYLDSPKNEHWDELHYTINFSINLGFTF